MLDVEEARARILGHCHKLNSVKVNLIEALGMVLDEEIIAPFDIPSLPNSAMDGYAALSSDLKTASKDNPTELMVISYVAAGQLPTAAVSTGNAIRIMTGAPIPYGADVVIPFEKTDEHIRIKTGATDKFIGIHVKGTTGENIRPAGEDISRGQTVLKPGAVMRPPELGVAASLGRQRVLVFRRPIVSIISTGDEIIEPGEEHQPGKVYNSNAYSVAALVKKYGGIPLILETARDTVESLDNVLKKALDTDLVITSAGVSKGDYDVVKDVLMKNGEIALWSVRMRPAKPLAFGTLDAGEGIKVPHLGLPGNPVSAMVAFEQFGRPMIRKMMGMLPIPKPSVKAVLDDEIINHDGRRVYARVIVYLGDGNQYRAKLTGNQSSGVLTSMALANGLAICPENVSKIEEGQFVQVEMLDWPEEVWSR